MPSRLIGTTKTSVPTLKIDLKGGSVPSRAHRFGSSKRAVERHRFDDLQRAAPYKDLESIACRSHE